MTVRRAQPKQVVLKRRSRAAKAPVQPPELSDASVRRQRGAPEPSQQIVHVGDATFDQAGLARQTYLSVPEAVAYLRVFPTADAFREWACRHRIPKGRAGRKLIFLRRDLDRAVQPAVEKGHSG